MKAVMQTAKQNVEVLKTLKLHIGLGLSAETTEDNSFYIVMASIILVLSALVIVISVYDKKKLAR